jgi:hypothetical protein
MKTKIIIKTAGRAGSHLITDWFEHCGYKTLFHDPPIISCENEIMNYDKVIIHDHNIDFMPPDYKKYIGFLVLRKDLLAQILSKFIVYKLGNYQEPYPNKILEPFEISIEKFDSKLKKTIMQDKLREETFLKHKIDYFIFYYEDFCSNTTYFKNYTDTPIEISSWKRRKTPYSAKEIIKNYEEIKRHYESSF